MKPILFNTEMTIALLDGRKTQTRRKIDRDISNNFDVVVDGTVIVYINPTTGDRYKPQDTAKYQVGDILWVRETFCLDWCDQFIYKADGGCGKDAGFSSEPKWKPSIHMPRKAARLFLKVTDVRVEKLDYISIDDALAEGFENDGDFDSIHLFASTWDSIDTKPGDRFDDSPWVWVYEFERLEVE